MCMQAETREAKTIHLEHVLHTSVNADCQQMDESEVDYPMIEPDEKKIDHLVSGIQQKFGLELLGIDVIIENRTGRYGVIDINVFPGTWALYKVFIFCCHYRLYDVCKFLQVKSSH